MNEQAKPQWASRAIIGSAIMAIVSVIMFAGNLNPDLLASEDAQRLLTELQKEQTVDKILAVVGFISAVMTYIGRRFAKTPVKPLLGGNAGMILMVVLVLVGIGCTGITTREQVLLPNMANQWQVLEEGTGVENPLLEQALVRGDGYVAYSQWGLVEPKVRAAIDDREASGEVSPSYAQTLREAADRMDRMTEMYVERKP